MNIALILAGGCGSRTGQDVPKQYLTVFDTPIIVYTMKNIQASNLFQKMYVVCSDDWSGFVNSYAKQYNIENFCGTINAGKSRFDSMKNGLQLLKEKHNDNDIVCIFDANRPLTPHKIISDSIKKIAFSDCVIALEPCYDSMFISEGNDTIKCETDRSFLFKGQPPETAYLGTAYEVISKEENNDKKVPLTTHMLIANKTVKYVSGSSKSMKITTADDFMILKALLGNQSNDNLK